MFVLICLTAAFSTPAGGSHKPDYTSDLSVWPNSTSYKNSDPWIAEHHDSIRRLEPRVLVLNFANCFTTDQMEAKTERMIHALAESSRYHGFNDRKAPSVLNYEVFRYIDLKDESPPPGREKKNGRLFPKRADYDGKGQNCDYGKFFTEEYAKYYNVKDPRKEKRLLSLEEMIELGIIHELWFWCVHDEEGAPLETIEEKQYYSRTLKPIRGRHGPAGNGHSSTLPWVGRSFRVTFFNHNRGIGCGLENFSHAMEGMAHYGFCPYYKKYFYEFAEFNLDEKYGLPFNSFYGASRIDGWKVRHTSPTSFEYHHDGAIRSCDGYEAIAGNVHFPPGAKSDYDMKTNVPVMSTMEHYRLRDGPNKKDLAEEWKMERFYRYNELAPDGMGPWLVYWRQCMPGLDNKCLDDARKPMKNWWIFLFY